jgi:hypothetical protein
MLPTWNVHCTLTEGQREYRSTAQVDLSSIRTVERIRVTITRPSGARYDFGNLNHRWNSAFVLETQGNK